jgi:hypothetical protein
MYQVVGLFNVGEYTATYAHHPQELVDVITRIAYQSSEDQGVLEK